MAETFSGTVQEAGNAVKQGVKKVGNKIAEKAEEVQDWAKQKLHKAQNRLEESGDKAKDAQATIQKQSPKTAAAYQMIQCTIEQRNEQSKNQGWKGHVCLVIC